jgi:hypothetical protein
MSTKTIATLTVALDTSDLAAAALHRVVLASLPQRFLITQKQSEGADRADIAVVSGRDPSWIDRVVATVDAGAKGILLAAPTAADPAQIRRLAIRFAGRAIVAVDARFAADPTWAAARAEIATGARTASLVDSVVTVEDATKDGLFGGLVEQLAVLRPLIESFDHLTCVHHSRQLAVVGNSGAVAVSLTASARPASGCSLRLDVVSSVRRWQAHFADDALARPTEITVYDGTGTRSRPWLYASAHRTTWLQLHAAITEEASIFHYSLADLATDLELAHRVFAGSVDPITSTKLTQPPFASPNVGVFG